MSSRAQLGKTSPPKSHKGKPKKLAQTSSHAELKESLQASEEVTGDPQRSKDRVIALLDEKVNSDTMAAEMFVQLQARDKLIEQMNVRLMSMSRKSDGDSQASKDKQVKSLLEEKSQMAKSLKTSEERIIELETKLKTIGDQAEEEKIQQEVLNEALTEESEALKAQLKDKAEQLRSAKNDIVEMSKIVDDLSKLNNELNEKIKALNDEMERNNTEHYQATKKAEQVEELERELVQSKTAQQQLEVKLKQASEDAGRVKELKELIYRVAKETDGVIAKISVVEHEAAQTAAGILDKLVAEMRTQAQAPRDNMDRIATLKNKLRETQEALEEERRKAARAQASEKAHLSRVDSLAAEHERMKASLQDHIERLKKRLDPLQGVHEKANAQRRELELKVENLNAELQRKQTEAAFLSERQQAMKAKFDEVRKSEEENRKAARELRLENIQLQSSHAMLQETANALEQKGKESRGKQTAMNDELWKRDNDLLRKEMQRLKLVEELNELKTSLQHAQARLKSRAAEDMNQLNARLEDKDKEIAALKRMLQTRSDPDLPRNGPPKADPPRAEPTKKDTNDRELAEKLEDSLRRVKALADMGEEGSNTTAAGILKALHGAMAAYQDTVISAETISGLETLHRVCGDGSATVAEILSKAGSLLPS